MKLCVVTSSRADYGLLKPLLLRLSHSQSIQLNIVVAGMHLLPEYGYTKTEIVDDGFDVSFEVDTILGSNTAIGTAKSVGLGVISFTDAFSVMKPNALLLLGDRFEIFSVATAAMILDIPIIHLHGGELSGGSIDDIFRHAITKMSTWHLAATETYRKRLIQLGEEPKRVWNVGGFGIDAVIDLKPYEQTEIEEKLNLKFGQKNYLITYHPETMSNASPIKQIEEILSALRKTDATLIFTMPNVDANSTLIRDNIKKFVEANSEVAYVFENLGQRMYLSVMRLVDAVIGNSSSGLIEAPALKIPTLNVGSRQFGRARSKTVIDCDACASSILSGLAEVASANFQKEMELAENPYGVGGAACKAIEIIENLDFSQKKKIFFDIPVNL